MGQQEPKHVAAKYEKYKIDTLKNCCEGRMVLLTTLIEYEQQDTEHQNKN
jgi:hypothetical protein